MKVNISKKFLIFNAHQHFLDEFLKDGMSYKYGGVDLGLGVVFVTSVEEVEVNATLFLPLFNADSFLWIAYESDSSMPEYLPEDLILDVMSHLELQAIDSVSVGDKWQMIKFKKKSS